MKTFWMGSLAMVALLTTTGCKQKDPQPIPAPKAASIGVSGPQAAGIAWFQGSLEEAFSRPRMQATCGMERAPMAPLTPDLPRVRNRAPTPAPSVTPRRPLV